MFHFLAHGISFILSSLGLRLRHAAVLVLRSEIGMSPCSALFGEALGHTVISFKKLALGNFLVGRSPLFLEAVFFFMAFLQYSSQK